MLFSEDYRYNMKINKIKYHKYIFGVYIFYRKKTIQMFKIFKNIINNYY